MSLERVQKILAQVGLTSRRKAEELISAGLVTINGKVAKLGDKADLAHDAIKVEGKLLVNKEPRVYLAFHKPRGVISMMADPEGRPTLASYLGGVKGRIFPVGRLDFTSEGLILMTNDGDFAEKLQRRDDVARVYHVKVKGHPTREMISRIERGVRIGRKLIKPHTVRLAEEFTQKALVEVVILGSGAFDIKALFEMKGFLVERIIRNAIGHLTLNDLSAGTFKHLQKSQVEALIEQPELGMRLVETSSTEPVKRHKPKGGPRMGAPKEGIPTDDVPDSARPKIVAAVKTSPVSGGFEAKKPRIGAARSTSPIKRGSSPIKTVPVGLRVGSGSKIAPRTGPRITPERDSRYGSSRPERTERAVRPTRSDRAPRTDRSAAGIVGAPREARATGGFARSPKTGGGSERGYKSDRGTAPQRSERGPRAERSPGFASDRRPVRRAPGKPGADRAGSSRPPSRGPRPKR